VLAAGAWRQEVTLMVNDEQAVGVDGVRVVFDDERVVSDAGVVLVATLAGRLGVEGWSASMCVCGGIDRGRRTRGGR
jgi:hypothetical protein